MESIFSSHANRPAPSKYQFVTVQCPVSTTSYVVCVCTTKQHVGQIVKNGKICIRIFQSEQDVICYEKKNQLKCQSDFVLLHILLKSKASGRSQL